MGRAPCCDKANVKKGPWSPEEDDKLKDYIEKNGTGGNWIVLPQKGASWFFLVLVSSCLKRCGKSCRLRWLNYLRPNIKHGDFSEEEDKIICSLYASIGSRWSIVAAQLPGRTDNDIKNYWNSKLKKKLMNIVPPSQKKFQEVTFSSLFQTSLSTSPLSFKDNSDSFYKLAATSYTCPNYFISFPSSLVESNSPSLPKPVIDQQSDMGNTLSSYQVKDSLVFGGEGSCSSSDGSCRVQRRRGQGQDYEYAEVAYGEQLILPNYLYGGVDESQKFKLFNECNWSGWTDKQSEMWGEDPTDYGIYQNDQMY